MGLKKPWVHGGVSLCFLIVLTSSVCAQEASSESATIVDIDENSGSEIDWKQEITLDRDALHEQRQEIGQNAQAARDEEHALKQQMDEALKSGDFEAAKQLRDQLHSMHQENMAQRRQDTQELKGLRDEFKEDVQNARQEGVLPLLKQGENSRGFNPRHAKDRLEDARDRRKDRRDNLEDKFDRREDVKDSREDVRDHREDIRDRKEDKADRREDIRDRREDVWDRQHDGGLRDKMEDRRDRQEDVRDRREDIGDRQEDRRDRREDVGDRRENRLDRGENRREHRENVQERRENTADRGLHRGWERGVRDHGAGVGVGKVQGGEHRGAGGSGQRGGSHRGGPRGGGHGGGGHGGGRRGR